MTAVKSLTVVITDSDARAEQVRATAARWAAQGLLKDSIWLSVEEATIPASGPPTVLARLVDSDGSGTPQDLFTLIAVRRIDLLRIVVLQLLPHGVTAKPEALAVGVRVAELVKGLLPRDVTSTHGGGTALVRVNLLVPETGASHVSQELLAAGWEINAIASPEDRPDLDQASVLVRDGVNYHAHATAALACVGGLWPGVPWGAFDDVDVDSTTAELDLVVFRPSARLLLGDALPQQIADAAMVMVEDPGGEGSSALVPWAAAAQDPDDVVSATLNELVTQGEWARDELGELDAIPPSEFGFAEAFSDLARFQGRLVLAAGRVVRNTATRLVENTATKVTAGSDGRYIVRVEPRTPDELMREAQDRLEQQAGTLRSSVLQLEATKVQPPLPSTWTELRRLCFGLADGSALPAGISAPERASTREILPPTAVAPHPGDTFEAADGTVIRSADVAGAVTLRARLTQGKSEPDPAGPSDSSAAGATEDGMPDTSVELDEWVSRRSNSLLWRLAASLWARQEQAHKRASAAYEQAVETLGPESGAVRKSRTTLLVCWAIVGVLCLGAGLWAARLDWATPSLTWPRFARGISLLLLLCAAIALFGGWVYYKALSRFERQIQLLLERRRHASEVFVVASREARRLELLYGGVRDWAEIIGWLLHEPWIPSGTPTEGVQVEVADLPASVAIAVPAASTSDLPIGLTQQAVSVLCSRGWTTQLFDDVVAATEDRRARRNGDQGHLPADLDAGVTNSGARQQLIRDVASPDLRRSLADPARERVAAGIANGAIELPARDVVRLGDYAAVEPISDTQFYAGALGPATPFVSDLWSDQGMQERCHVVARSLAWIPTTRADGDGRVETRASAGDCSVRVDISRSCVPAQLALFEPRGREERPSTIDPVGGWV